MQSADAFLYSSQASCEHLQMWLGRRGVEKTKKPIECFYRSRGNMAPIVSARDAGVEKRVNVSGSMGTVSHIETF